MHIRFDSTLPHQIAAIEAVTKLFEGQPRNEIAPIFKSLTDTGIAAVPNELSLSEDELLTNLQRVQRHNFTDRKGNLTRQPDVGIGYLEHTAATAAGEIDVCFPNFSVEMETGTGKTYVYIRTALDLFRRYGYRKYIIVVPSVAIREGVLKTFEMTRRHFALLFENTPYRYAAYDSANLSQVRQFALSDAVEFLVMTLAAFNKASNVVYRSTDRLQGETPIYLLQAARPILILDEPQNMESEKSISALAELNPLFALRYSATHRVLYNLVYRLTPRDAYRDGLVKHIEVASVVNEQNINQPYLQLKKVDAKKTKITASLVLHQLQKSGQVKEKTVTVGPGDDLRDKAGNRPIYAGWTVEEINITGNWVRFSNGVQLHVGEEIGSDKEALFEAQILATVEEHVRRQGALQQIGIKVLSLFFIDKVDNYQGADALLPKLFAKAFERYKGMLPQWKDLSAEDVSAAYFASKRSRSGDVTLLDTKTGESARDQETYDLIMKDKERLLSLDEPVSFIFSHSALREGWDNPNVFQICTLNQSVSDMRKRQEIGRGVRISVNQRGNRVFLDGVNVLTVIANESYEEFVQQYQQEIDFAYREQIEQRFGKRFDKLTKEERVIAEKEWEITLPPPPNNARKRITPQITAPQAEADVSAAPLDGQRHTLADGRDYELPLDFVQLWDQIRKRTRYSVTIDSDALIKQVTAELAQIDIPRPQVVVKKAVVRLDTVGSFQALQTSAAKRLVDLVGRFALPNIVEIMLNLMEQTSPPMRLTRATLLRIVQEAPDQDVLVENPHGFATTTVNIIKQKLSQMLVDGITYHETGEYWEMKRFQPQLSSYEDRVVPATKTLYSHVIYDSEVEKKFAAGMEALDNVKFYLKLPDWFKIDTPIGGYNPDWALVWGDEGDRYVYLVRETKGTREIEKLQFAHEGKKIKAGKAHFRELAVDYDVVVEVDEIQPKDSGMI